MMFSKGLPLLLIVLLLPAGFSRAANTPTAVDERVAAMDHFDGYFPFHYDAAEGKIWMEITRLSTPFLYMNSLPAGVGSNDIGLDRGQIGDRRLVYFERYGSRLLLIEPNLRYRAASENPAEQRAVAEAFAMSTLWGFDIAAESGQRLLVDATPFLMRDVHQVVLRLKNTGQGSHTLDESRSALYMAATRNFPDNSEFDVLLTFTGTPEGGYIRSVAPSPEAVTVREHHSFIRLPDDHFQPRRLDPRAGYFGIRYADYGTPIGAPLHRQFIARHRLNKKDPSADVSEAIEPIVYYLDNGTPEPVRSALLEGARWWDQAFERLGYRNAFRVEMLPADADPLDIRYNVIQWVHRATRGWSYGDAVMDPRTGEIIKGHVTLGSLRVRQDFLIAEGLLSPYTSGQPVSAAMEEMALARLRQLSAHEVGHTLGLNHNFAASVNDRASVMDYPHPLALMTPDGRIELSDAYATGIGDWDKVAIAYGYQDFPEGADIDMALEGILRSARERGLHYITDADARPAGGSHPLAHLWDNGADATAELLRVMAVRRAALDRFSEAAIAPGRPLAALEEVLVPIYYFHRYQTEAAVKQVGGLHYTYALRGDGQQITAMVSPADQRRALQALLATLSPQQLAVPESLLRKIPPRAPGMSRGREVIALRTAITFDILSAAEAAANHTLSLLLNSERAARLVAFHARNAENPGLHEVIDDLCAATVDRGAAQGLAGELQRVVNYATLRQLMSLAADESAAAQVRAISWQKLGDLQEALGKRGRREKDVSQRAHLLFLAAQVRDFLDHPRSYPLPAPLTMPAGSPIGSDLFGCGFSTSEDRQ